MLDLSYANQFMMKWDFNYDITYNGSLSENYNLFAKGYYGLNFNYLISKEFKKANQFYIGIGVKLDNFLGQAITSIFLVGFDHHLDYKLGEFF